MLTKRMAMRRMNEMWTRTAVTLVFCVLLLHTCQGQDQTTVAEPTYQTSVKTESEKTSGVPIDPSTTNPTNSPTTEVTQATDNSINTPDHSLSESTNFPADLNTSNQEDREALNTSKTGTSGPAQSNATESSDNRDNYTNNGVVAWGEADKSGPMQSQQTPVFVPIVVSGLILAAALIGLYIRKNHWHTKAKGMKLAEESCMADEENQGNTLVSVAPLNPPESQEKPNQNGESLEAVKTQNPPTATNGHSTAKADTEL